MTTKIENLKSKANKLGNLINGAEEMRDRAHDYRILFGALLFICMGYSVAIDNVHLCMMVVSIFGFITLRLHMLVEMLNRNIGEFENPEREIYDFQMRSMHTNIKKGIFKHVFFFLP